MKIAITGASGFLGRYLIQASLDAGHQVRAWSRKPANSFADCQNVQWIQGELGNSDDANELVRSADAVIHSGLFRSGDSFLDSGDDPLAYWHKNATGSLQLLDAAHRASIRGFVFVSSGAVHEHVLPDRPLDETHPLLPGTLYGACKASVETLVHHYGTGGLLPAATVRPTSIYGVAKPVNESKWFGLVQSIVNGHDVQASGGSKTVHAHDVAKAALLVLDKGDSVAGETFNCCDRMISEFEVATIAKRLTDSESKINGKRKVAKHQIDTTKIESIGMNFGGDALLEQTVAELVHQSKA